MPLTDTFIKTVKPEAKAKKHFDGGGLYLLVTSSGSKLWRIKYRFAGKEKTLSPGPYPLVSLREARRRCNEAHELLHQGIDPNKAQTDISDTPNTDSFEMVAREWFSKHVDNWRKSHSDKIIQRLERDVFPWIGNHPIANISAPELLNTVRKIEGRGTLQTAHLALQNCGRIFRYAVATGRAERDPSGDLKGALSPVKHTHFAAITTPAEVGALLRAIDAFRGTYTVKAALQLAPLVFVRPGELMTARWRDINLDEAEWRYTVSKTNTHHLVPLSRQTVTILKDIQPLTGKCEWVFMNVRGMRTHLSDAAINAALRRLGYDTKTEMTGHGFRAMARTLLHERLNFAPEVIEHQLAHKVPDALGAAYNRTKFIDERKRMMQAWADYLDKLKQQRI